MKHLIDICVLVCRRAEFTKICFEKLIQNTDWSLVNQIIIVHDMPFYKKVSEEIKIATQIEDIKCQDFLKGQIEILEKKGIKVYYKEVCFGSVVRCQKHAMEISTSEYFLKVDSDVAMGEGYLSKLLETMESYKELVVLGYGLNKTIYRKKAIINNNLNYGYIPCPQNNCHVGGLVMVRMNKKVKTCLKQIKGKAQFDGWSKFQKRYLCKLGRIGWYWPNIKNLVVIDRLIQKQLLIDAGLDYDKLVDLVLFYHKNHWIKQNHKYYKKALEEIEQRGGKNGFAT